MPNCKPLSIIKKKDLETSFSEPYKLVTFSRVTEKKGIGTVVDVVMKLNKKYGREVFTLDIFGPIDPGEDERWFDEQSRNFSNAIVYRGNASYSKSVEILSKYFALLFPTQYYTEGIPGTIIDSYAAGVPVIASKWKSFTDVVEDGVTGLGYKFNSKNELEKILEEILFNPSKIIAMKSNCLSKAYYYLPEHAIQQIINNIQSN